MPARVLLVHDDPEFVGRATPALEGAGYTVAAFLDPLQALDAVRAAGQAELMITRMEFEALTLNGVALARMAKMTCRNIRVIFTASPELREHAEGLGEFLPLPVDVADLLAAAGRALGRPVPDPQSV